MSRPRGKGEDGFLLLEVLVAFVIAALALAVLFEAAGAGLRATSVASRYEQAVARARSHLAAMGGAASRLVPGIQSGDDGSGFRWQVQVTPLSALALAGPPARQLLLYRVSVTESWPTQRGERAVQLTTARLQEEGPPGS
ncbi:MAG TPA: type II secretion system protein [Acetobacteraceae bacterium]|nr:type II secretion system protein [Acetobacteraceae bacterium]